MQRLAAWDHCIKICVCSISPPRKLPGRDEVIYAVSAGPVLPVKPLIQFQLHTQSDSWLTTVSFLHGQRCLSSPHRPASLALKGLTESSKECEGSLHGTARDLLVSTSNSTSHELLHCVRNNFYLLTFVTLFPPLPRAIVYHHQLCELRLLLNWNFLKKKKRERKKKPFLYCNKPTASKHNSVCICVHTLENDFSIIIKAIFAQNLQEDALISC